MDIKELKGVGEKKAALYLKLGIKTVEELTEYYPRAYIDLSEPIPVHMLEDGEVCAFAATVVKKLYPANYRSRVSVYKAILSDGLGKVTALFFNSKFVFESLKLNRQYIFFGRISGAYPDFSVNSPAFVEPSEKGMIPKYHLTAGLTNNNVTSNVKSALALIKHPETLPVSITEKYDLIGADEAIRKVHFPKNHAERDAARRRLAFEELLTLRLVLSSIKNRTRKLTGAVMADADMSGFYGSLPFVPTEAQLCAVNDCIADMKKIYPMNRLIQGDVGTGKTMVAAACDYFARCSGFTTLVMAPTEVLAKQHYETFRGFLEPIGVKVGLLTGSMTAAEKKSVREASERGEIEVLIGTHALIQKSVLPKRTGLIVVDEQHRFGVAQRSELAGKGANPHIMAMSATPIPRTLALIIYGDLDVSVLNAPPKGRIPIKTYAVDSSFRTRVYNFIKKHIADGEQAFIVCPRVERRENDASDKKSAIEYYEALSNGEFKGIPTGLLYGRMKQADKDAVMNDFRENRIKLLISTTVIEVGIDVPNATVMLIENAELFGLSQLHQLRGRVGRGSVQGYCILMSDNSSKETAVRMTAMKENTDGYKIAEIDLKLRGPGNFFGNEQSGVTIPLKAADFADDTAMFGQIDALADEIIRRDPTLSKPENEGLRRNVAEAYGRISEI